MDELMGPLLWAGGVVSVNSKKFKRCWEEGAVCKEVFFHPFNFLHFHHRRQQ